MRNTLGYPTDELAARRRFQAKLDQARRTNDYRFFAGNSPEFFDDQLDWVELVAWQDKRTQIGDERSAARTLGTISEIGAGLSFVPVAGQLLGVPLAAAAGAAAQSVETGLAAEDAAGAAGYAAPQAALQGGVVYGQGESTYAITEAGQIVSNVGTPGAKELLDAAKVATPHASAQAKKGALVDAGVTALTTFAVAAGGAVGGLAGDVIDEAGRVGAQGAEFAARGDFSPEADLEFGVGVAGSLADFGAKEVAGAASATRQVISRVSRGVSLLLERVQPLAQRSAAA